MEQLYFYLALHGELLPVVEKCECMLSVEGRPLRSILIFIGVAT